MDSPKTAVEQQVAIYDTLIYHSNLSKSKFVAKATKILNLCRASIYNRISGKCSSTINEILSLMEYFKVPYNVLFSTGEKKEAFTLVRETTSCTDYLQNFQKEFNGYIHKSDLTFFHSCNGLPIFYYLLFPKLATFKMFYWDKIRWNTQLESDFHFDYLSEEIMELAHKIGIQYLATNRIDFWNPNTLNCLINELEFGIVNHWFVHIKDAEAIFEELSNCWAFLVNMIHKESVTTDKAKTYKGEAKIYYTKNHSPLNIFMTSSTEKKIIYNFYSPTDFFRIDSPDFCNKILKNFSDLEVQSSLISGKKNTSSFIPIQRGIEHSLRIFRQHFFAPIFKIY